MAWRRIVAFSAVAATAAAEQASPVAKALELLSSLQAKVIKEGESSQKVYSEFSEWCEDRSRELSHEIKTGKAEVTDLKAVIAQEEAKVAALTARVEKLASDIATDEADIKAATSIRKKEHTTFVAEEKELVEVVDTLERAVAILEREMKSTPSMMQLSAANDMVSTLKALVDASKLSTADASKLTALVQASSDDEDSEPPAGPIYKSSSGGIVETLSSLLDDAEDQLSAARDKETKSLHAFELMEQGLKDEIKFAKKEMAEAKEGISTAEEKKSTASGDLSVTSKELSTDTSALSELHQNCMSKAQDFELETKNRGEELNALAEAKKVLQEKTGGSESLTYGFDQVSFLQVSSKSGLKQIEALRLLRDLARKDKSLELQQLTVRMNAAFRSSDDPFAKVKGLIQDMISKLETEAEADATKKAYCDKELAETKAKKESKTAEIEKLSTQIDKLTADSTKLKEEVAELQKGLSALTASQAQMDKIRAEEKALYETNKAELEQGLEGVKLALKVLKEYYAKGSGTGAEASTGIIGMLEVVESDFSKNLASITAAEESAATGYDVETKENSIEKATKEQDVKYKTKESAELDSTAAETKSDLASSQSELDAILEYLSKIEGECIAKAETYEERQARFTAEINGCKEALKILESETATALLQRSSLRGIKHHRSQ